MSDYPSIRPSLNLEFARTKKLDPRVTFRRASTGTYVDSDGLIKTAGIDTPRFDHDPVTGVCKGLLVEESRTNSITYSEDFSNAVWTKSNVTVFSNALNSPSGGFTATKVVETIANSTHSLDRNITLSPGSGSIFLKAGERTKVRIYISGVVDNSFDIDLSVGVLTRVGSSVSQTPIITALNNSWYRVSWPSGYRQINILDNTGGISYTGDGVSGIYIWGAQLEAGSFPTSYIPTTASTVTRSAEITRFTGANFNSWYNVNKGTTFFDAQIKTPVNSFSHGFLSEENSNQFRCGTYISSWHAWQSGSNIGPGSPILSGSNKGAFCYDRVSLTQSRCFNGTTPTQDRYLITSSPTDLPLVYAPGSVTLSKLIYWPTRLSDAQLQLLTRR